MSRTLFSNAVDSKKVFVLLGHPDKNSFSGLLADQYEQGTRDGGYAVKRINLGECHFDPVLRQGYRRVQELEPDLKLIQDYLRWADHVVVVYPNWWGSMPALLKGMFDRMFLPGFAFRFLKDGSGDWEKLLTGKTGRIIMGMDMVPWKARMRFGDPANDIRRVIFGFAGISPIRVSLFGPHRCASERQIAIWKKKVYVLGRKGQ